MRATWSTNPGKLSIKVDEIVEVNKAGGVDKVDEGNVRICRSFETMSLGRIHEVAEIDEADDFNVVNNSK